MPDRKTVNIYTTGSDLDEDVSVSMSLLRGMDRCGFNLRADWVIAPMKLDLRRHRDCVDCGIVRHLIGHHVLATEAGGTAFLCKPSTHVPNDACWQRAGSCR